MFPRETERLPRRSFTESDVDAIYALVYADSRVKEAWSSDTGTLEAFQLRFATDPVWHAEDGSGFLTRKAWETLLVCRSGGTVFQEDSATRRGHCE